MSESEGRVIKQIGDRRTWVLLTETSFVYGVWFVLFGRGDWMAVLYKDAPASPWKVTYRYRYYRDADAWGSKDERSGAEAIAKDGSDAVRDALIVTTRELQRMTVEEYGGTPSMVRVEGNAERFSEAIRDLPQIHTRESTL